jgi:hypothetical protein
MVDPVSSPALSNFSPFGGGTLGSGLPSSLHITASPRGEASPKVKGIGDFLNELKLARENAILGSYEEALKKYKGAL